MKKDPDCHDRPINKLAYQRSLAGMTQQALANAAGINIRQVQKIEYGEYDIANTTVRIVLALAKALNCEVEDLM